MANKYFKTSFFVTGILFVGYFISFIKESTIAKFFGVSGDVDAYTVAITVPVNLFSIIALSIQPVVIPIYSKLLYGKSQEEAAEYINSLICLITIVSLFLIGVFEIFASPIVFLFAPGLDTEVHQLAVSLIRLTLPTILFTLLDRVFIGVLNVQKQFVLPSLSVYFLNLSIIVSIVLLHSVWGIKAACFGQVIGSILQVLFLLVIVKKYLKLSVKLDIKSAAMRETGKSVIPIIWSTSISEVNAIVNRAVASFLFIGAISAISYSTKINSILILFFTSAISQIVYPLLAESSAKENMAQLNNRVNSTMSIYLYLLIPLMVFVFVFRTELIEVAFARGVFDSEAVDKTQRLLGIYSISIFFLAIRDLITKVFYSLHDTKNPAINTTWGLVLNIVLSLTLPFMMGVEGLALATTLSSIFMSVRLLNQLVSKHSEIDLKYFMRNVRKIILPAAVLIVLLVSFKQFAHYNIFIMLIVGCVISLIAYLIMSWVCKIPVYDEIISLMGRKKST